MVDNGTPVVYNNDGFNGGMGIWSLLIFAMFMMNGGWGGWGANGYNNGFANAIGYENLATSNEVQRGFDNQNTQANQREILAAVNDASARGIAATNQTFHDTLNALNDKYSELARDIANVNVAQHDAMAKQQECCCETLRAVDAVNYNNALNTASINANTTAQTQKILDALAQNQINQLQGQVNQLQLKDALAGVVRYPNAWTYNAGTSPFCNSGCCYSC